MSEKECFRLHINPHQCAPSLSPPLFLSLFLWLSPHRDLYAEMHVAELLAQILSGVNYLHSRRVIHLDLKSDNMLVTDRNILKIVDLGSAQSFTPGQTLNIEHIQGLSENKGMCPNKKV